MGRRRDLYEAHMDQLAHNIRAGEAWWLTPISKRRKADEPQRRTLMQRAMEASGDSVVTYRDATPFALAYFRFFFMARCIERMDAEGVPWERYIEEEVASCR